MSHKCVCVCACVQCGCVYACIHACVCVYVFFMCGLGSVPVFPENLLETNLLLSEIQYDLTSYSELKIYP